MLYATKVSTSANILYLLIFMGLLMTGCYSSVGDRPELGEVTGVVTLDGRPLPNANVMFHPNSEEGGRRSIGVTDESGRYELMYMQGADTVYGAKLGDHIVAISTQRDEDDPKGGSKESVSNRYRGRDSELKATVKKGRNDDVNFELTSK